MSATDEALLVAEALLGRDDDATVAAHAVGSLLAFSIRHELTPRQSAEALFKALPDDDAWPELQTELVEKF